MWWSFAVPIAAVVFLFCKFRERLAWWEPVVVLATPAMIIAAVAVTSESIQVRDIEWCTDKTLRVEHYEPYVREWQEWVPERGHTDKEGCYVVDVPGHYETRTEYHPEHWEKVAGNGRSYGISQAEYGRIAAAWSGVGQREIYTDLHHPDQRHRFLCPGGQACRCSDGRGDMFHVQWPSTFDAIEPVTWTQAWENRVQATTETVFRFPDIPAERARQLFALPYPDGNANTPAVLGPGGPTQAAASERLMRWNAVLGPRPENQYERACRMWVLVFANSPSDQEARDQEAMWKGGNKNEFTLCLGLDSKQHVAWAYPISWTDAQGLKIDVRDWVQREYGRNPVDLVRVVDYMGQRCKTDFIRKRSRDWSYISIQPPTWVVVLCWLLTIGSTTGVGWFVARKGGG